MCAILRIFYVNVHNLFGHSSAHVNWLIYYAATISIARRCGSEKRISRQSPDAQMLSQIFFIRFQMKRSTNPEPIVCTNSHKMLCIRRKKLMAAAQRRRAKSELANPRVDAKQKTESISISRTPKDYNVNELGPLSVGWNSIRPELIFYRNFARTAPGRSR